MFNDYEIQGQVTSILLTHKRFGNMHCIIDTEDLPMLIEFNHKWHPVLLNGSHYVLTGQRGKTVYLHRYVMDAPKHLQVDHINHDTLDNRHSNLRLVTSQQNNQNKIKPNRDNKTSGIRGVTWDKNRGKWMSKYILDGKTNFVGRYDSLCEAEQAIKAARANNVPYSPDAMSTTCN